MKNEDASASSFLIVPRNAGRSLDGDTVRLRAYFLPRRGKNSTLADGSVFFRTGEPPDKMDLILFRHLRMAKHCEAFWGVNISGRISGFCGKIS